MDPIRVKTEGMEMEQYSRQVKIRHSFYLILATVFWGTTFVAQSVAMDFMGPYFYNVCRFLVGAVILLPVALVTGRRDPLGVNYHGGSLSPSSRGRTSSREELGANCHDTPDAEGKDRGRAEDAGDTSQGRKEDAGHRKVSDGMDANHPESSVDLFRPVDPSRSTKEVREAGEARSRRRQAWHDLLKGGFLTGLFLFLASNFQQVALVYTTAGKCGFVTALYIIFVPIFGFLFFRKKCSPLVIAAITTAIVGFYFLCIKEGFTINQGDFIALFGAVMFAFQILAVDRFAPQTSPVQLSCMQFVVAGLLSIIPAFLVETPSWSQVRSCIGPILYAGIVSCGGGYTLQTIGQRGLNPTIASLFMSLESVISAISGWLILGDALSGREIFGCCLVFAGVILAQIPLPRRH